MKDPSRTHPELIEEISFLKQRIKELEATKISEDEATEYAESVINTVREPLIVLDQNLRVVTASRSFFEFFKVNPKETVGQLIYDLGNKQWDIPKLRELLETILPQKATFDNYEVEHDFATIGRRIMLLNARQIQRVLGKERIILLAIEDITEHKRLENILTESEELYRGVFRTASDGILLLEKHEGKITHINPAAEKMLGYTKKECIGNKLQDIGFMLDMGDFQTTIQTLNKTGIINYDDVQVKTKSGQHIDTDVYLVDRARLVQCNIRDITSRKRSEEKLLETSSYLQNLIIHANAPIIVWDPQFRITQFNRAFEFLTGRNAGDVIGKSIELLFPMAEVENTMNLIRKTLIGERLKVVEINIQHIDGPVRTVLWNSATIFAQDGKTAVAVIAQGQEITERKQAEAELNESKALIEAVVENVPLMIFLKEAPDLHFVIFNRAGEELLGYDRRDLVGKNDLDLFPPEQAAHFMAKDREVLDGEIGMLDIPEEPILTAKKGQRFLHTRKVCIRGPDGATKFLLGISEDITERKLAEEHLKETLEKLRKSLIGTIQALSSTVETRDPYTAGHQRRVSTLARIIAQEMGLPTDTVDTIRMAGTIHDIGKISVPAEILSRPVN
jgi:PAS domain S-box-containing protein